jgi:hypothetical protein
MTLQGEDDVEITSDVFDAVASWRRILHKTDPGKPEKARHHRLSDGAAAGKSVLQQEAHMANSDKLSKTEQSRAQPDLAVVTSKSKSNLLSQSKPFTPITVGEPADAASLAIDQRHMEDFLKADLMPGIVECKRPPKATYFTVKPEDPNGPPENRGFYFLLEASGRDPYLVSPAIADLKKDDEDTIRPIYLVRYVTMAGEEGLWPVKLNSPDGKSNRWNTSALNALKIAEEGAWVRLISKGEYRATVSPKTLKDTPPRWSNRTFKQLVNAAFPADRVVTSLDHPIWEELTSGRDK